MSVDLQQAIVTVTVVSFIVVCAVLYHLDTIRKKLKNFDKPEIPDGIKDFTDEDWFFAEAHSPELLKWRPIEARQEGASRHWYATRSGMCHECGTRILVDEQVFPASGYARYMHYDCAVDNVAGLPKRRVQGGEPRRMRRTTEEIESTPPDD